MVDLVDVGDQMGVPESKDQSYTRLNGCSVARSQRRQETKVEGGHMHSSVVDSGFQPSGRMQNE